MLRHSAFQIKAHGGLVEQTCDVQLLRTELVQIIVRGKIREDLLRAKVGRCAAYRCIRGIRLGRGTRRRRGIIKISDSRKSRCDVGRARLGAERKNECNAQLADQDKQCKHNCQHRRGALAP